MKDGGQVDQPPLPDVFRYAPFFGKAFRFLGRFGIAMYSFVAASVLIQLATGAYEDPLGAWLFLAVAAVMLGGVVFFVLYYSRYLRTFELHVESTGFRVGGHALVPWAEVTNVTIASPGLFEHALIQWRDAPSGKPAHVRFHRYVGRYPTLKRILEVHVPQDRIVRRWM